MAIWTQPFVFLYHENNCIYKNEKNTLKHAFSLQLHAWEDFQIPSFFTSVCKLSEKDRALCSFCTLQHDIYTTRYISLHRLLQENTCANAFYASVNSSSTWMKVSMNGISHGIESKKTKRFCEEECWQARTVVHFRTNMMCRFSHSTRSVLVFITYLRDAFCWWILFRSQYFVCSFACLFFAFDILHCKIVKKFSFHFTAFLLLCVKHSCVIIFPVHA